MKKRIVIFSIVRSEKQPLQFLCRVKHGSAEITFTTENHRNHVDLADMVQRHIAAISEGRFRVVDEIEKEARASKRKPKPYQGKLNRNWP
jgi:hypothetical protein